MMTETRSETLQDIVQLNLTLLETLRQEEWDALSTLSQDYIQAAEATITHFQQATGAEKKDELAQLMIELQANEAEIARRLQARMQVLNENMLKLQQSKKSCQHYAAQTPRRFG